MIGRLPDLIYIKRYTRMKFYQSIYVSVKSRPGAAGIPGLIYAWPAASDPVPQNNKVIEIVDSRQQVQTQHCAAQGKSHY